MCPIPIGLSPLPSTDSFLHGTPPAFLVEQDRGRSRSRSPRRLRPPFTFPNFRSSPARRNSFSRSRSRSPSPPWRHSYLSPRSFSPAGLDIIDIPPPSPSPFPFVPQSPQFIPPPSWYVAPSSPSGIWRTQLPKEPADILTFNYKNNMAYAPAAKTYHEAIDIVLELWPELRAVERDQIRLLVGGSGELVRVPRMTWSAVLCDIPRYEIMHVQVEERPPPPKYQGKDKGKGKWGNNNEKGRRSGGLFSSIKRIFSGRVGEEQGEK